MVTIVRVSIWRAPAQTLGRAAHMAMCLSVVSSAVGDLVTVRWVPASVEADMTDSAFVDDHLAVDSDRTSGYRWRECADVLTASRQRSPDEAMRHAVTLRRGHPGCAMVAVALPAGWLVLAGRDPTPLVIRYTGPHRRVLPSGLYGWSVIGRCLHDIRVISAVR